MERLRFPGRWIFVAGMAFLWAGTCVALPPQIVQKPAQAAPAKAPAKKAPAVAAPSATAQRRAPAHLRDPFAALVKPGVAGTGHPNLPPGIAGLEISTLRLQGMAKDPEAMIAIVSNPEDRVYFLHDGDHLYDGIVEKIGLNQITFRQQSKDAFGRLVEREVTKRLYPIAGE